MAAATPEKQKSTPTEKMLAAAKAAASRHNVDLPPGLETDFEVCKTFLDAYLNKPSPKALSFAERIAKEKNLAIPAETLASAKELSSWIDQNKAR